MRLCVVVDGPRHKANKRYSERRMSARHTVALRNNRIVCDNCVPGTKSEEVFYSMTGIAMESSNEQVVTALKLTCSPRYSILSGISYSLIILAEISLYMPIPTAGAYIFHK